MKINRSLQFIGRFITSILILGITAFFTPGFTLSMLPNEEHRPSVIVT